jgi:hypothetical protein
MAQDFQYGGAGVDLSPRIVSSTTVAASPALAAETIVASVALPGDIPVAAFVYVEAYVYYTVGTSGVSGRLRIKQTNAAGTTIADTGALTVVATNLVQAVICGRDAAPAAQQVYVATLIIGSGAAVSTVSAVMLRAIIV